MDGITDESVKNEVDLPAPLAPGMAGLLRSKMTPLTFRGTVIQGRRFTAKEALERDLVDKICPEKEVLTKAKEVTLKWAPKAKAGIVYKQLKEEVQRIKRTDHDRYRMGLTVAGITILDVHRCCSSLEHSLPTLGSQNVKHLYE